MTAFQESGHTRRRSSTGWVHGKRLCRSSEFLVEEKDSIRLNNWFRILRPYGKNLVILLVSGRLLLSARRFPNLLTDAIGVAVEPLVSHLQDFTKVNCHERSCLLAICQSTLARAL